MTAKEFSKFCAETKQLRQILKDTQRCFQDINQAGVYEGTQIVSAELSEDEEKEIASLTKRVPSIVILGQDNYAKAFVANEIMQKKVLPQENCNTRWRSVLFRYGNTESLSLQLPGSYELVDARTVKERPWSTVPLEDLLLTDEDINNDRALEKAVLEVKLRHCLLKEGGLLTIVQGFDPRCGKEGVSDIIRKYTKNVIPVVIYTITSKLLSPDEYQILQHLREVAPHLSVFFLCVPSPASSTSDEHGLSMDITTDSPFSPTENGDVLEASQDIDISQDSGLDNSSELDPKRYRHAIYLTESETDCMNLFQQLVGLGYLSILPTADRQSSTFSNLSMDSSSDSYACDSELVENFDNFSNIIQFTRQVLQNYLLQTISLLNLVHTRCLQMFIMCAFDMARDMQITPRKLEFAKSKEIELYTSLMEIAVKKQDEIRLIIEATIENMRESLLEKAAEYEFIGVELAESCEVRSAKDLKICTGQIQDLVLSALNSAIAGELLKSVSVLKDSYTGVLTRCLESLEQSDRNSMDSVRTSLALREILQAAYKVEITVRGGASVVRQLLEKMKQLMHMMPWSSPPIADRDFKESVATNMLNSLNSNRLANSICSQIKEKLRQSHDSFASALQQLEQRHSGRLERTEERRLKVRKVHAPRVARLVLESTSLRDYIHNGMPNMGREVGRGQYGVVYSCEKWGNFSPVAIKSVVPPDDKHWNDLAMEFFYTKNVPEHERLVALRGSVIDYSYGGGSSPAVLLMMDRLQRDLYAAIKANLDWKSRLQVALDVVEGIRYLHSQGLVHRDIKLKNVLLDKQNRGKLTDLGFCKPEAMMSGSIVGTPIHMAPELFSGKYDNSVDVYAFGVLFWYVCAGTVKLPLQFEQCTNKEMLWTSVKRGVRPEKLSCFTHECWELMRTCWKGEPRSRPLLGNVHQQLLDILRLEEERTTSPPPTSSKRRSSPRKSASTTAF